MSGNVIHADHYIEIIGAISHRWKRGLLLDKFSSSVAAAVWQLCMGRAATGQWVHILMGGDPRQSSSP